MAESIAKACQQPTNNNNNNNNTTIIPLTISLIKTKNNKVDKLSPLAFSFKYKYNFPKRDINEIRRLLSTERANQNETQFVFYTPDYERLMEDDWLVTRFLLRGIKANTRCQQMATATNKHTDNTQSIYAPTMDLIRSCAKYRYEFRINAQTKESEFPLDWTSVNGIFKYKHDLAGNPILYMQVALHRPKLIETEQLRRKFKRYMLYVLEQCDQDLYNKPGKAICCVFDMTNAAFENVDLELTSWMIKSFKSCSPKLICYVIVYNPPWFFTATFKLICNTLLSNSKRQSIKFAYGNEILDYIDYGNLPLYIKSAMC